MVEKNDCQNLKILSFDSKTLSQGNSTLKNRLVAKFLLLLASFRVIANHTCMHISEKFGRGYFVFTCHFFCFFYFFFFIKVFTKTLPRDFFRFIIFYYVKVSKNGRKVKIWPKSAIPRDFRMPFFLYFFHSFFLTNVFIETTPRVVIR